MRINIGWNFENSYASLPETFLTKLNPTPVSKPELVVLNHTLAKDLGLDPKVLKEKEGIEVFAGNHVPKGALPLAQAYAGHQFGHFTMLGDGRAILIGEKITPNGKRFDIQLKGPGRTPYSRRGDGRATLGPMLREYIISEAMHALGIPTTRSMAVVTTGEKVMREEPLPGAILTRIAKSHIRVGTFEYAARMAEDEYLKALADYTIERHYPKAQSTEAPYLNLLKEVVRHQAGLISQWMLVGFIHGVMNTDNMTIAAETIDYGPCAFMDTYDPKTVFSSIDRNGRYAYSNQPKIAQWNLARFAETLLPLLHDDEDKAVELAQDSVMEFTDLYQCNWLSGMRGKLGISNEEPEDNKLAEELLSIMHKHKADYTNTFRSLTFQKPEETPMFGTDEFAHWHSKWQSRLDRQVQSREAAQELMKKTNPAVIPRNHRVEEALEAAVNDDYTVMEKLLDVLSKPFSHHLEQKDYTNPPGPSATSYRTYCGT